MLINKKQRIKQISLLQKEGFSLQKVANFADKSERTIYRWIKATDQPKQKEGPKFKVVGQELESLLAYVLENNTKTQSEIADYVARQMNISVSRQTIGRILQRHDITRKKITYHYFEQSEEKINEFKRKIKPLLALPIFALDECSFHLGETPRYGYAEKGFRTVSQRMGKRSINYTLILCIQNIKKGGVFGYELIEGGAKSKNFHGFLSNLNWDSKENHIIMDNARIHHATKSCHKLGLSTIRELLTNKNVKPNYLPPYTPELNPVELCFNFIRQQMEKKRPKTLQELKSAIDKIIDMLNQKDLMKYFRHCFDGKIWH